MNAVDIYTQPPYSANMIRGRWTLKQKAIALTAGTLGLGALWLIGRRALRKMRADKSEAESFQTGSPETNAKLLKMAFENDGKPFKKLGTIRAVFISMKSKQDFDTVRDKYKNLYGHNLWEKLKSELQTTEYQEMLAIKHGKPDREGATVPYLARWQSWARRLKAAFDKTYYVFSGTDEAAILAVLNEIPSQQEFINTGVIYKKEFGENLITRFKSESSGSEMKDFLRIVAGKPKK